MVIIDIITLLIALNAKTYAHNLANIEFDTSVVTNGTLPIKKGKLINLLTKSEIPVCTKQATKREIATVLKPFLRV